MFAAIKVGAAIDAAVTILSLANLSGALLALKNACIVTRIQLILLRGAEIAGAAASGVLTAATWLLNFAMLANPITLVVIAVIALVAIFIIAYKKSEKFRKVVDKAWAGIKKATAAVWDWIKRKTAAVWGWITSKIGSVAGAVKSKVSGAWSAVKSATSNAWGAVKAKIASVWNGIISGVRGKIDSVVAKVRGIKGKVLGVFSGAGSWLWRAGYDIIMGLVHGIDSMIGFVKSKLQGLTNLIPSWKGPAQRDKKLLTPAGELIMLGLVKGFDKGIPKVRKALSQVTDTIGDYGFGATTTTLRVQRPALAGGSSARVGGNTYQITVNAPVGSSSADIGRTLASTSTPMRSREAGAAHDRPTVWTE